MTPNLVPEPRLSWNYNIRSNDPCPLLNASKNSLMATLKNFIRQIICTLESKWPCLQVSKFHSGR